jgi:hypothetical protein
MKWKPEIKNKYYFITECLIVESLRWNIDDTDAILWKIGNCFRTRKQAQQMAKKIKEMLKGG